MESTNGSIKVIDHILVLTVAGAVAGQIKGRGTGGMFGKLLTL